MKLLTVDQLCFAYPQQPPVLRDLSFSISAGEIITILGPNGVGKSTLLQCLLGLLHYDGIIKLTGRNLATLNRRTIAQTIAYVPQQYQQNTSLTVADYVLTGRTPYLKALTMPQQADYDLVSEKLAQFDLQDLDKQPLNALSGGQLQLVTIIKALVQQPQLLILDEPMAALDLKRQREVIQLIQQLASQGVAVLLTTHQPDHALILQQQVGLLTGDGHFSFGPSQHILTENSLRQTYQTPVKLTYLPDLQRYTCQLIL